MKKYAKNFSLRSSYEPQALFASIEDVIKDARNGRMFILIDDENRENEGDLIIPAQMATPEAVNFMARYGRGLICLALTSERVKQLELSLMTQENESRHDTAFTVSIEAKEGVTTGISAHDRARTIATAIDPSKNRKDISTPGHIFPLVARDGGVLVRAGHTEAAVDIARLAGLIPAGVICEIMNDDGTMARLPDLIPFAKSHGLRLATIRDLIAYRRKFDNLVRCVAETQIESSFGGQWLTKVYINTAEYAEHLALIKGRIVPGKPVLVRVHVVDIFSDLLAEGRKVGQLATVMRMIAQEGTGVVVVIRDTSPDRVTRQLRVREEAKSATKMAELREYGIGAQILCDLGVKDMILLSNTHQTIVGLEGYDLNIIEQRAIPRI